MWVGIAALCAGASGPIAIARGGDDWRGMAHRRGRVHVSRRLPLLLALHCLEGLRAQPATRAPPAKRLHNGRDFVPTNKIRTRPSLLGHLLARDRWSVLLTLAAQFGFLPGRLFGRSSVSLLGGAVQDFLIPV